MELIEITRENADLAFNYWKNIGGEVPYFFEATKEAFCESLFSDRFYGAPIFNEHHILAAVEEGRVKGLVQFGLPCFHFTEGKRIQDLRSVSSGTCISIRAGRIWEKPCFSGR